MDNQSNKKPKRDIGAIASELVLTAVVLGFIISGLLGGASLTGHITLPAAAERGMGGLLIGYVVVGTALAVHFGIKFLTRKK